MEFSKYFQINLANIDKTQWVGVTLDCQSVTINKTSKGVLFDYHIAVVPQLADPVRIVSIASFLSIQCSWYSKIQVG